MLSRLLVKCWGRCIKANAATENWDSRNSPRGVVWQPGGTFEPNTCLLPMRHRGYPWSTSACVAPPVVASPVSPWPRASCDSAQSSTFPLRWTGGRNDAARSSKAERWDLVSKHPYMTQLWHPCYTHDFYWREVRSSNEDGGLSRLILSTFRIYVLRIRNKTSRQEPWFCGGYRVSSISTRRGLGQRYCLKGGYCHRLTALHPI